MIPSDGARGSARLVGETDGRPGVPPSGREAGRLGRWLGCFAILNLYVHLAPLAVPLEGPAWLGYALGFFILTEVLSRLMLGTGLLALGLGWGRSSLVQLAIGFALGAGVWAIKNLALIATGKFEIVGLLEADAVVPLVAQALLVGLLGSAMNDVLIRGLWYRYFAGGRGIRWFIGVTTALYVLDDMWAEGPDIVNAAFSLVLGFALAYTVVRTGSIWMAIGIHWGGNLVFRLIAGFDGQGILVLGQVRDGPWWELLSLAVTALLVPLAALTLRTLQPGEALGSQNTEEA